jgi:hypothetical protein
MKDNNRIQNMQYLEMVLFGEQTNLSKGVDKPGAESGRMLFGGITSKPFVSP